MFCEEFSFLSFFSSSPMCKAGALVWAKLEGHPWWPCMVVPQPLTGQLFRGRGRDQRVHVHFFDEPPTRGWVSTRYIREYQGTTPSVVKMSHTQKSIILRDRLTVVSYDVQAPTAVTSDPGGSSSVANPSSTRP